MTPSRPTLRRSFLSRTVALRGRGASLAWLAGLAVAGVLASGAGCGSESTATACSPGAITSCSGPAGCTGEQICADDGGSFGACSCDSEVLSLGGAGSGGSGGGAMASSSGGSGEGGASMGAGGAGGASMANAVRRSVGAHCAQDSDCAPRLICVSEDDQGIFGDGGPARGYCTSPCTREVGCGEFDPLSVCEGRDAEGNGFCFAACAVGQDGEARCAGPEGDRFQACINGTVDLCIPRCLSDADCSEGRSCDLGPGGGCLDTPVEGGAVGASCTRETEADDCASSICLDLVAGGSFCSGYCSTDLLAGCGFDADSDARGAACLQSEAPNGITGDIGYCFELCDVGEDCIQPGSTCDLFPTTQEVEVFGRAGVCEPG